jgi:hypothetical protein
VLRLLVVSKTILPESSWNNPSIKAMGKSLTQPVGVSGDDKGKCEGSICRLRLAVKRFW